MVLQTWHLPVRWKGSMEAAKLRQVHNGDGELLSNWEFIQEEGEVAGERLYWLRSIRNGSVEVNQSRNDRQIVW